MELHHWRRPTNACEVIREWIGDWNGAEAVPQSINMITAILEPMLRSGVEGLRWKGSDDGNKD